MKFENNPVFKIIWVLSIVVLGAGGMNILNVSPIEESYFALILGAAAEIFLLYLLLKKTSVTLADESMVYEKTFFLLNVFSTKLEIRYEALSEIRLIGGETTSHLKLYYKVGPAEYSLSLASHEFKDFAILRKEISRRSNLEIKSGSLFG